MQGTLEVSVRTSCPSGFVQYQCCSCIWFWHLTCLCMVSV